MNSASQNKLLNFRVSGDGYPVVFLHGFLESMTMWKHIEIPDGIKAVFVDLPGHGKSSGFENQLNSMEQMANQVQKVVDSLDLISYKVVGHSMGGYVGLELMKMDNRCNSLMLLNSNPWGDSPQKKVDRKRVAEIVKRNKSHFLYEAIPNLFFHPEKYDLQVRETIVDAMEMSPEAIGLASVAMSIRKDNVDWVLANSSTVTIVQGAEDAIVPLKKMNKILKGSNVRLHIIENVGHMAHIEASTEVQGLLKNFIQ